MIMILIKITIVSSQRVVNVIDLGYLYRKGFPRTTIICLPLKGKKTERFTTRRKRYNESDSKKRIVVEHTICQLKKYRIMSEVFRNKLRKYNRISEIVSDLINYRILNQSKLEIDIESRRNILDFSNYARDLMN